MCEVSIPSPQDSRSLSARCGARNLSTEEKEREDERHEKSSQLAIKTKIRIGGKSHKRLRENPQRKYCRIFFVSIIQSFFTSLHSRRHIHTSLISYLDWNLTVILVTSKSRAKVSWPSFYCSTLPL